VLAGSTGLIKTGTGTLTLTGVNTYTGVTTINGGTLSISANNNLGSTSQTSGGGGINLANGGTLQITQTVNDLFRTITLGTGGGVLAVTGGTTSLAHGINGGGGLTKTGGGGLTLAQNGGGNNIGAITINAGRLFVAGVGLPNINGSTIAVANGAALVFNFNSAINLTNTVTFASGARLATRQGTLAFNTSTVSLPTAGTMVFNLDDQATTAITVNGDYPTLTGNLTVQVGGVSLTVGDVTFNGAMSGGFGLTKTSTGKLILAAASTHSGATTVSGGVLQLNHNLALQNSALSTSGAGTVTLSGATTPTFGGLTGSTALASVITSGYSSVTALTLNPGSGVTNTYSGVIANGAAGMTVTKTGAGTQILTGANTYTGTTTISNGSLQLGNGGTTGALSASSTITNNGTLVFNRSDTLTQGTDFASVISGSGAVTQAGTGTTILTGANTYTGLTTVSAGTLVLQGTYASSGFAISSGSALELNAAASTSYGSTTFSGAGTLRKTGAAEIKWPGSSAIFAMDSGSLIDVQQGLFVGGNFGNENWTTNKSDLNIAAGAYFAGVEANVRVDALTGGGTLSTGYPGAGYATFTIGVDNGSGTFSGVIMDGVTNLGGFTGFSDSNAPGNLTKVGSGTQILTGINTYTGLTTVSAGTLQIGNGEVNTSVGASSFSVASGATLAFFRNTDNTDFTTQAISGGGDVEFKGQSTGYYRFAGFSGALTYTGRTIVNFDAPVGGTAGYQRVLWLEKDNVLPHASVLDLQSGKVYHAQQHDPRGDDRRAHRQCRNLHQHGPRTGAETDHRHSVRRTPHLRRGDWRRSHQWFLDQQYLPHEDWHRHANPHRREYLHRRDDDQRGHSSARQRRHHGSALRQQRDHEQRHAGIQPQRHPDAGHPLRQRDQRVRRGDAGWFGHHHSCRIEHLHRYHDGERGHFIRQREHQQLARAGGEWRHAFYNGSGQAGKHRRRDGGRRHAHGGRSRHGGHVGDEQRDHWRHADTHRDDLRPQRWHRDRESGHGNA
jgi:autotransporter-associated beta strand protein